MRTRALYKYIDETGKERTNVVWFGSTGIQIFGFDSAVWDEAIWDDAIGKTLFYNDKKESFSTKQQSVVDSLTQRLSIIKNELWYAINYGCPLIDKNRSKIEFDNWALTTITKHPDVEQIISFKSEIKNAKYSCIIQIQSVYGPIDINI